MADGSPLSAADRPRTRDRRPTTAVAIPIAALLGLAAGSASLLVDRAQPQASVADAQRALTRLAGLTTPHRLTVSTSTEAAGGATTAGTEIDVTTVAADRTAVSATARQVTTDEVFDGADAYFRVPGLTQGTGWAKVPRSTVPSQADLDPHASLGQGLLQGATQAAGQGAGSVQGRPCSELTGTAPLSAATRDAIAADRAKGVDVSSDATFAWSMCLDRGLGLPLRFEARIAIHRAGATTTTVERSEVKILPAGVALEVPAPAEVTALATFTDLVGTAPKG